MHKDINGREPRVQDYIAVAMRAGNKAEMRTGKVVALDEKRGMLVDWWAASVYEPPIQTWTKTKHFLVV